MRQGGRSRLGEGQLLVFARCETQLGLLAGLPLRPDRLQEVCKQPVPEFGEMRVAHCLRELDLLWRSAVFVAADGSPGLPGDPQDHERDREADQRIADGEAERDDDRGGDHG